MNSISNSVNNTVNNIGQGFQKSLEVTAYAVDSAEALEKIAKIAERIIRVVGVLAEGLSTAVSNFGSQLKDTIIVFETLRFIGVLKLLTVPGPNGKYFLTDAANSWMKRADRVTLAFHCAFKTVKGLNKFGFVDLGVMAKDAIGKLPIFVLVMDSFILASSFFSSWDNIAVGLPKARKKIAEANAKIDKWEYRPTAIALLKANDEIERKFFESKYDAKAKELHAKIEGLEKKVRLNDDKLAKAETSDLTQEAQDKIVAACAVEKKKLNAEITKASAKLVTVDDRIAKIAARDCRGLAEDLEKADTNFKVRKWEVCKSNGKQDESKVWIRLANAVGKIAVVVLALTLTAVNVWTAPFMLSLLFLGIVVDSIGLSKILLEEFWKPKAIPKPATA